MTLWWSRPYRCSGLIKINVESFVAGYKVDKVVLLSYLEKLPAERRRLADFRLLRGNSSGVAQQAAICKFSFRCSLILQLQLRATCAESSGCEAATVTRECFLYHNTNILQIHNSICLLIGLDKMFVHFFSSYTTVSFQTGSLSGIAHHVNFQNKTLCADSISAAQQSQKVIRLLNLDLQISANRRFYALITVIYIFWWSGVCSVVVSQ